MSWWGSGGLDQLLRHTGARWVLIRQLIFKQLMATQLFSCRKQWSLSWLSSVQKLPHRAEKKSKISHFFYFVRFPFSPRIKTNSCVSGMSQGSGVLDQLLLVETWIRSVRGRALNVDWSAENVKRSISTLKSNLFLVNMSSIYSIYSLFLFSTESKQFLRNALVSCWFSAQAGARWDLSFESSAENFNRPMATQQSKGELSNWHRSEVNSNF